MFNSVKRGIRNIANRIGFKNPAFEAPYGVVGDDAMTSDQKAAVGAGVAKAFDSAALDALFRAYKPNRAQRRAKTRMRCTRNVRFHMKRGGFKVGDLVVNTNAVGQGVASKVNQLAKMGF